MRLVLCLSAAGMLDVLQLLSSRVLPIELLPKPVTRYCTLDHTHTNCAWPSAG
jgi:hypothetical protein